VRKSRPSLGETAQMSGHDHDLDLGHDTDRASPTPTHSHSHSHDRDDWVPASSFLRRVLAAILLPIVAATVIGLVVLWPRGDDRRGGLGAPGTALNSLAKATVTRIDVVSCEGIDSELDGTVCLRNTARITNTADRGKTVSFNSSTSDGTPILKEGTRIVLVRIPAADPGGEPLFSFYNFQRTRPLQLLVVAFVLTGLLIGRLRGLRALVALAISLTVLIGFMLPSIVDGRSPLLVAIVGASAVMLVALYLSHGFNVRTTCALIGTVTSLCITGLLARGFVSASQFTGLADDDANYLRAAAEQIDVRGLLLAGIIIGALGILDDVTVTQASAVWELHQASPQTGFATLFTSGMRIGRDHIASTINTLVLAYAGAALPLLLLFTQSGAPWREVALEEAVATEIVRTLVGSIGLMSSVPITTALTALLVVADRRAA
jgi:uncharacterized membrane protein